MNLRPPTYIDLGRFKVEPGFRGKPAWYVQLWWLVQMLLLAPSPQFMYGWRRFWWRRFGAKIGQGVLIRPSVRVTYPWKVSIGDESWIGDYVELYSLGSIQIGRNAVVSQYSYICAGTHDYGRRDFPLVASPVVIEDEVWIAAGCFIAPGLTVGQGAVVGARSVVLENVAPATVVAGHPARFIKPRPVPNDGI